MTSEELAEGVQFTVDQSGRITAVVVAPALWQHIIEALEDAQDRALAQALRSQLADGPGASGALRWQAVADQKMNDLSSE